MSDLNIYADQTAIDALTPITGDVVLRASDNAVLLYNGSAWKEFQPDAGPGFSNQYSVAFDGSNDYINIPDDPSLTIAGDLSISAWVYRDSTDTGYLPILVKRSSSANATTYQFYVDFITGGGLLRFYNGTIAASPSGGTSIPTNQWVHVAITVESGVTNGTKWYVNGTAESSTNTFTIDKSNTAPATIGRLGSTGNYYAKGKIDEVSIFNSALSASDVAALIDTTGSNPVPANISSLNPVGWWRMGENNGGVGSTITDQGSGGNDATLMNGADIYSGTLDPNPDGAGPDFSSSVPS